MNARRFSLVAAATLLLAACWGDLVTNESVGPARVPAAGTMFERYVAIGTSISAGFASGGISDSLQRLGYVELLARAMGHTLLQDSLAAAANRQVVQVTFRYPSFRNPGCPPPITNVTAVPTTRLTPAGFPVSTDSTCYVRNPISTTSVMNNLGIAGLRAVNVMNIGDSTELWPAPYALATFVTGGLNPIDMMDRARPTFITLEVGANDVLGSATTTGDTTALTDLTAFQASFAQITSRIVATGARVAVMKLPAFLNAIPHLQLAQVLFTLKFLTPKAPFNSANFTVDSSCAPRAIVSSQGPGVGDSTVLAFKTTATIAGVLTAGGAASINCATDVVTITTAAGTTPAGPMLVPAETRVVFQRIIDVNTAIQAAADAHGWAVVDYGALLLAQFNAGKIPAFPDLTKPTTTIFGSIFSLDGIHHNAAGHRLLAQAFADAIRTTYGVTLTIP